MNAPVPAAIDTNNATPVSLNVLPFHSHSDIMPEEVALIVAYLRENYDALGLDMDGSCVRNEYLHHEKAVKALCNGLIPARAEEARNRITWKWWLSNLGSGQHGIFTKITKDDMFPEFRVRIPNDMQHLPVSDQLDYAFVRMWEDGYCKHLEDFSSQQRADINGAVIESGDTSGAMPSVPSFLDTFVRPGLHDLVAVFASAARPVFVYSVSEERMLKANLNAIDIDYSFAIPGNYLEDDRKKPAPDGWVAGVRHLNKMDLDNDDIPNSWIKGPAYGKHDRNRKIIAKRTLVLEDTDKGVEAVNNFKGKAIRVSWPGEVPSAPFSYRVREDAHIFQAFRSASLDWADGNKDRLIELGIKYIEAARSENTRGSHRLFMPSKTVALEMGLVSPALPLLGTRRLVPAGVAPRQS